MARLNPFDIIGYGSVGEVLCKPCADREAYAAQVRRYQFAGSGAWVVRCDECSAELAHGQKQTAKAADDVKDVLRVIFPDAVSVQVVGTGGGCEAVEAMFASGAHVMVTNADASQPDGFDLCAAFYASDDDDDPRVVFEAEHDMAALTAALVAVKGA